MRTYESAVWDTDLLPTIMDQFRGSIECAGGVGITQGMVSLAREAGSPSASLSRWHLHEPRIGLTAGQVIGRFPATLHICFPNARCSELIEMTLPLLRRDYGFAAISEGISALGGDALGSLLKVSEGVTRWLLHPVTLSAFQLTTHR